MIRIIHYFYTHEEAREGIYITKDLTTEGGDFIPPGCEIQSDTNLKGKLAGGFPLEHNFDKVA